MKKYIKLIIIFVSCIITLICLILFAKLYNSNKFYTPKYNTNIIMYSDIFEIDNKYYHSRDNYCQGLFFYDGILYETNGHYGKSNIIKNIKLTNNQNYEKQIKVDDKYFLEGSVIFNDKLYVLTWREKKVFIYDKDSLELIKELDYQKDGWGLTTDNTYLIATDGSNKIYFMDENLNDINQISVKFNNQDVYNLNELEYINGYIWANIYQSNYIAVIDPKTGDVINMFDFSNILDETLKDNTTDVLNGIAFKDNKLYITGKNWPILFELKTK